MAVTGKSKIKLMPFFSFPSGRKKAEFLGKFVQANCAGSPHPKSEHSIESLVHEETLK
jgi:hypothetical protein